MASTEELNGLNKGLADIVQTQQTTNADAFKQTTEQLQNLLSTVEALSKSIAPQAVSSLSDADAALGLCLPHITLPVFTGKENLDHFVEQITSLLSRLELHQNTGQYISSSKFTEITGRTMPW